VPSVQRGTITKRCKTWTSAGLSGERVRQIADSK
jgi:hypothetical protein